MVNPAVAPYVPAYASRNPYITAQEYQAAPTGVNVSELVPRGSVQDQTDTLNQMIAKASALVDNFCLQVLGATIDIESGRYRINRDGYVKVPVRYTPVVQVNSFQFGSGPASLTAVSDLSNVEVGRKVISFPIYSTYWPNALTLDGTVYGITQYVNGYANSVLASAATAGATTVTLNSALGVVPGLPLTFSDPGATEMSYVASVSGNTVTLSSPLVSAHASGVSVGALPPVVKEATILLTSALIKTRGAEAIVMSGFRAQPSQATKIEDGGLEEIDLAVEMLLPFRRAV